MKLYTRCRLRKTQIRTPTQYTRLETMTTTIWLRQP